MTAATSLATSPWPWVVGLLFAVASYGRASHFHRVTGRSPWGVAPVLWGLLGFLVSLLGFILCCIAAETSKDKAPRGPSARDLERQLGYRGADPSAGYGPPATAGQYGSPAGFGASGGPGAGNGHASPAAPAPTSYVPGNATPASMGQPSTPAGAPSDPPGWRPDPSGRFDQRYWSGTMWTEHVVQGGIQLSDPVPPPP